MVEHTPGPWLIENPDSAVGEFKIISPDGDDDPWNVALTFGFAEDGKAMANARLIAAAPDLLTALADLIRASDGHGNSWRERDNARAVLNKMAGGAS